MLVAARLIFRRSTDHLPGYHRHHALVKLRRLSADRARRASLLDRPSGAAVVAVTLSASIGSLGVICKFNNSYVAYTRIGSSQGDSMKLVASIAC